MGYSGALHLPKWRNWFAEGHSSAQRRVQRNLGIVEVKLRTVLGPEKCSDASTSFTRLHALEINHVDHLLEDLLLAFVELQLSSKANEDSIHSRIATLERGGSLHGLHSPLVEQELVGVEMETRGVEAQGGREDDLAKVEHHLEREVVMAKLVAGLLQLLLSSFELVLGSLELQLGGVQLLLQIFDV
ncbi:hypothetical protein N7470_000784 [Penicillium chermesinum]|nr:hypothetical protein N7470_000784 [Penicillium chermesinum]